MAPHDWLSRVETKKAAPGKPAAAEFA